MLCITVFRVTLDQFSGFGFGLREVLQVEVGEGDAGFVARILLFFGLLNADFVLFKGGA